jgi:hypothetical protein
MNIREIRDHGHHLAMAASLRLVASRIAMLANPEHPDEWFTELGQDTFDYVDRTHNPAYTAYETRAIKEAAYGTLRMIFDSKGFEGYPP